MSTFNKPAKNVEQQLELLKQRGLSVRQPERALRFLEVVSFFRLSIYMRPFQVPNDKEHRFKANSEFKDIVELYAFDRELRLLVIDAIERVEVAVRASLNNHMSCKYQNNDDAYSGSHWYLNRRLFKQSYDYQRLMSGLEKIQANEAVQLRRDIEKVKRSNATEAVKQQRINQRIKENYPRFYQNHYHTPALMPGWAMTEEITLGSLSHLYQSLIKDADRKAIARRFDVPHEVLGSWLHTLNFVRNCCAHHSRLWNRELAVQPQIPRNKLWELPKHLPENQIQPQRRIYIVLLLLAHLMRQVSPDSRWHTKVATFILAHPKIPLFSMGFPNDWQQHPFFQQDVMALLQEVHS